MQHGPLTACHHVAVAELGVPRPRREGVIDVVPVAEGASVGDHRGQPVLQGTLRIPESGCGGVLAEVEVLRVVGRRGELVVRSELPLAESHQAKEQNLGSGLDTLDNGASAFALALLASGVAESGAEDICNRILNDLLFLAQDLEIHNHIIDSVRLTIRASTILAGPLLSEMERKEPIYDGASRISMSDSFEIVYRLEHLRVVVTRVVDQVLDDEEDVLLSICLFIASVEPIIKARSVC